MLGEITLLAQKADNASVRQQFVTLNSYALPLVECRPIAPEETEDIVAESCHFTLGFGTPDLDHDGPIRARNL